MSFQVDVVVREGGMRWIRWTGPLVVLALVFLAGCDWSVFRFDVGHSGNNSSETSLSVGNVSGLTTKFAALTDGEVEVSPVVDHGLVYATGSTTLYAFDAVSGAVRWTVALAGEDRIGSSPSVVNGVVYIGGSAVRAFDAATGAIMWSSASDASLYSPFSSPDVVDGVVYATSNDRVYAMDAGTGSVKWTSVPVFFRDNIYSSPTTVNGVVYVASRNGQLSALDATTGTQLWSNDLDFDMLSTPAVVDGRVYVGTVTGTDGQPLNHITGGTVAAVDASTGSTLWKTPVNAEIASSPAVANGAVYAFTDDDRVVALDASTGAITWTTTLGTRSCGCFESSVSTANGVVYVGSLEGSLTALDASTGVILATIPLGSGAIVFSTPTVANGRVYFGSPDQHLYSLGLP